MDKPNRLLNKTAPGSASTYPDKKHLWYRELFVLFYLGMFAASFLNRPFPDSRAVSLLIKGAELLYAPGMIFAAGCLMGAQDASRKDFRKNTLRKALYSILLFYTVGFLNEILINERAVFATIKDLLAVLRIPGRTSIFLTLSVLFLLCSFCWPWVEKCLRSRPLLLSVCLVGFLFTFLPEGILGYGLAGVFVGADRLAAVPLFPYLFAFFGGVLTARRLRAAADNMDSYPAPAQILSACRCLLIPCVVLLVVGAGLALLHRNEPATTLLGTGGAGFCLLVSAFLLPLYQAAETFVLAVLSPPERVLSGCQPTPREKPGSGYFSVLCGIYHPVPHHGYFVFVPYIEGERTLIWSVDGLGQYVAKAHQFVSYVPSVIQDILHGNFDFQQYDFTRGLGSTISISFEPVYWLYLLFNPSQVEDCLQPADHPAVFPCGEPACPRSCCISGVPTMPPTLPAWCTPFSGYAIYAGTRHGQFLSPLMLLPILVIAMEQLITKKKWYLLTVFTAISLLCTYYFLYMNTIALGIYYVTRILCTKEYRNIKTFFTRGLIIVGSYILGVAMGSISIFTSFGNYIGSSRSGGSSLSDFLTATPLFYQKDWIADFFVSFLSDSFSPGLWLKLGFAPVAVLALVLLFTRKNKKELKPLFIIFTFFCLFPVFGYIFSGFSSVTNRWCYIYAAVIAFILAENLENFTRLTAREMQLMLGLVCLYAGNHLFSPPSTARTRSWLYSDCWR